jgi:ribosomal protein L11 methyltransferase
MFKVGRFEIYGEHEGKKPDGNTIILLPQPLGVPLYGWGDQKDTRDHLTAIEEHVKPGMRVADIGTGTGILAIAAARMGADVVAFESDPRVHECARKNFEANAVEIELRKAWPDEWDGEEYDLILANVGGDGVDVLTAGKVIGHG